MLLHIIELSLFMFSLFWVAIRKSKITKILPFGILAIVTIFVTILGEIALCVYDIVLFLNML